MAAALTLCGIQQLAAWTAAIDGAALIPTPQCPEVPTQRVRVDRHEPGVFGVLVGEVCAGHAVIAELHGALHLGEIPRHVAAVAT